MKRKKVVGVDGCPAGWCAVTIEQDTFAGCAIHDSILSLWRSHQDARCILIDMPIGLADRTSVYRDCDHQAGKLLGNRRSSIFSPPIREVIRLPDYPSANRLSKSLIGRGLSVQSWNISRKITELDCFLRTTPAAIGTFKESHPELCFITLNDMHSLHFSKKQPRGIQERLRILERYQAEARDFFEQCLSAFKRKDVRRDDIVDAVGLAVRGSIDLPLKRIPGEIPIDRHGLPMVIHY